MKLIRTYNQSFTNVSATGGELNFSWAGITKSRPNHKFLIRPSLVQANNQFFDVNETNNTFNLTTATPVLAPTTFTIPSGNYTLATLVTALTTLTGVTFQSFSGRIRFAGFSVTRLFAPTANSAHLVMGYITGLNYSGTTPTLTNIPVLDPVGYLFLNYPLASSKTGNSQTRRLQDNSIDTQRLQGRYQIAEVLRQVNLGEEDVTNNEGLLLDDMPFKPLSITAETESGGQPVSSRIEYNILFTIMEVDCDDEPKPITNKIVASHIRQLSYSNRTNAFVSIFTDNFFRGLVKRKPTNKWFIVCSMCNVENGGGSGRFVQFIHPSFTSKCNYQLGSLTANSSFNRYMVAMPTAAGFLPARMTNVGNGLLIDDFSYTELNAIVGQTGSNSGTLNFVSVFNIYELEY